jgi:PAS domain S-box-containing protein
MTTIGMQAEQAEERLSTSEAEVTELADQKCRLAQYALVVITDVQAKITYANKEFCVISQHSKDELIGRNHWFLNSDLHPNAFFHQIYPTIPNGEVSHGEIKNLAKDGSFYWVDTTIAPILNSESKPLCGNPRGYPRAHSPA